MAYTPYSGGPLRGTQGQSGGIPYIPALGPMGNAALPFMQLLFPAMGNISQLITTQTPFERMSGMAYMAEAQKMSGVSSRGAKAALDSFMAIKTQEGRAKYLENNAESVYMGAQRVGAMTGMPNMANYIPGLEKQVMRGGVLQGMQFMDGAGLLPSGGVAAKKLTNELVGMQLNLMPSQTGEMFQEMGRRGLIQGRMTDTGMSPADTNRIKGQVKQWDKLIDGMQDIFGDRGSIKELMDKLEQITQGSISREGPGRMQKLVNSMKYLSGSAKMSSQAIENIAAAGAHDARALGLSGLAGAEAAISGMALGDIMARQASATNDMYWNAGNRASAEEMGAALGRRQLMGKSSRTAIAAGGVLAMVATEARSRGLKGADGSPIDLSAGNLSAVVAKMGGSKKLQGLIAGIESSDPEMLRKLGEHDWSELTNLMSSEFGVSKSTMMDYMSRKTRAGEVYSNQLDYTNVQTNELFKNLAPRLRLGARSAKLDHETVIGALQGITGLKDYSDATVTKYLEEYLTGKEGVTDAARTAQELNQQINFVTDKDAGGLGRTETFGIGKAQAALKARVESFNMLDDVAKDISKMFSSDALTKGAFEALFSGDPKSKGVLDFIGSKSANAKRVIETVSPLMQALSTTLADTNMSAEEKAARVADYKEQLNAAINGKNGLTDKDRDITKKALEDEGKRVREELDIKEGKDKQGVVNVEGNDTKIVVKNGTVTTSPGEGIGLGPVGATIKKVTKFTTTVDRDTGVGLGESTEVGVGIGLGG